MICVADYEKRVFVASRLSEKNLIYRFLFIQNALKMKTLKIH